MPLQSLSIAHVYFSYYIIMDFQAKHSSSLIQNSGHQIYEDIICQNKLYLNPKQDINCLNSEPLETLSGLPGMFFLIYFFSTKISDAYAVKIDQGKISYNIVLFSVLHFWSQCIAKWTIKLV